MEGVDTKAGPKGSDTLLTHVPSWGSNLSLENTRKKELKLLKKSVSR